MALKFTLPNILTLFRLLVGPLFFYFYSTGDSPQTALLLLTLLVAAEGSDLLDGYLARRWGQVTNLGKILDPFADSLYRMAVFLTLTMPPVSLPLYLILIILYRESSISTLRTVVALKGVALQARWSGKIKAVLQGAVIMIVTSLLYLYRIEIVDLDDLVNVSMTLTMVAAIYTFVSGVEYLITQLRKKD